MKKILWGIDLGGTKIEGVVLDASSITRPLSRIRVDTQAELGYQHILGQVQALVVQLSAESGLQPHSIGFGTPGVIDPRTGLLKNSNTQCLNGTPLQKDLLTLLKVPVELSNDANCFALAEATWGAADGAQNVFGVIMGTGVGGGIIINGRVVAGHQGIAGEWGHNVVEHEGAPCYCGKSGCVETVISGPRLEKFYSEISGQQRSLVDIVADSRGNERNASLTVDRLIEYFGKALVVVINVLDPEVIVLGGGLSNIDELYTRGRDELEKYVFNTGLETRIVKNALGDSAGVFGAANLVAHLN